MTRFALLALIAAGCPYVPEGKVEVVAGDLPVTPGAQVSFQLSCDYLFDGWEVVGGPDHCGRSWMVQDVPGGSAEYGTIDECGVYTAPLVRPPAEPLVTGWESDWGTECLDCCVAGVTLALDGY